MKTPKLQIPIPQVDSAIAVLAAMITPAVLISACASLLVLTSTRLGRSVDRVRDLSEKFEIYTQADDPEPLQIILIFELLDILTSRIRLFQRIMTLLYRAVGFYVATSVALGVLTVFNQKYGWIPLLLGGIGSGFLFYASWLMIIESRLSLKGTHKEMDYIWQRGKKYAPAALRAEYLKHRGLPD